MGSSKSSTIARGKSYFSINRFDLRQSIFDEEENSKFHSERLCSNQTTSFLDTRAINKISNSFDCDRTKNDEDERTLYRRNAGRGHSYLDALNGRGTSPADSLPTSCCSQLSSS